MDDAPWSDTAPARGKRWGFCRLVPTRPLPPAEADDPEKWPQKSTLFPSSDSDNKFRNSSGASHICSGTTNRLRQTSNSSRGDVYGQKSTGGRRPDAVAHGVVGGRAKFDRQRTGGKCTGWRCPERRGDDAGVAAARVGSDAQHAEYAEHA